jgi:hypothetical protein
MEDKDLFEKVEKAFGITENQKIQKIYESGNFKKQLDEVVTSKSPSTGSGNLLGSIGKGIGAVARSIPGTRGFRMRSAEARAAEAAAKKAELENARLFAKLQKGDLSDGEAQDMAETIIKNASEEFKKVYSSDGRFKYAHDMSMKGKFNDLSAADKDHYINQSQEIREAEKAREAREEKEKLTKEKVKSKVPEFLSKTLKVRIEDDKQFTDLKDNIEHFQGNVVDDALEQFAILNLNPPTFQLQKTDIKNTYYEMFSKAIAKTALQQAIKDTYSLKDIEDGKIKVNLDKELEDARKFSEILYLKVIPEAVLDKRKGFITGNINDYFDKIKKLSDKQTKLPLDNGGEKSEGKKIDISQMLKSASEVFGKAYKASGDLVNVAINVADDVAVTSKKLATVLDKSYDVIKQIGKTTGEAVVDTEKLGNAIAVRVKKGIEIGKATADSIKEYVEQNKKPVEKSAKRKKVDAKRLKTPKEIGAEAKKILADKIKKAKVRPKYTSQNLDDTTDQA